MAQRVRRHFLGSQVFLGMEYFWCLLTFLFCICLGMLLPLSYLCRTSVPGTVRSSCGHNEFFLFNEQYKAYYNDQL